MAKPRSSSDKKALAAPAERPAASKDAKPAVKAEAASVGSDDPSAIPDILVAGDLVDTVRVIPHTMASLVMLVGKYENGGRVLAPYVELNLAIDPEPEEGSEPKPEGEEDDPEKIFTALLSLENASFILADFAGDLANIGSYLKSMAAGDLPLDKARMAFILKNLNWARTEVDSFISVTRDILAGYGVSENLEWPADQE